MQHKDNKTFADTQLSYDIGYIVYYITYKLLLTMCNERNCVFGKHRLSYLCMNQGYSLFMNLQLFQSHVTTYFRL